MMNLPGQWIVVCVFGLSCWAVGDGLRKALFPASNALPSPGRHSLSFAAGNVVFSYVLTILGFFGLLLPSVLWATLLAGVAVIFVRTIFRGARVSHLPGEKEITASRQDSLAFLLLTAVAVLFVLAAILQASAPPYARDSLVYHLLCPREYLKAGVIKHIAGNLYAAFPKGHEMLMTLLLAVGGDRAAQGFSVLQHCATAAGIFGLVRWMKGPWMAAFCAAGYATVPPAVYFSGCGYVDSALVMALLSGLAGIALFLHSWDDAFDQERIKGALFLGLLAGWMPAIKYTGLIYLGLIGFLLLWGIRKEPARKSMVPVGMFALAALPGFCWMLWNWLLLGNPVYPFGWALFGGQGWDASRSAAMSLYFDLFGMGNRLQDYLMLPWRLAFSGRFDTLIFDGAMGPFLPVFLLLSAASLIPSLRIPTIRRMPEGFGLAILASAAFFLFGTQQARFWLPTHLMICLCSVTALEGFGARIKSLVVKRAVFSIMLIFAVGWNAWFLGNQIISVDYFRPVWGLETERAFLVRRVPGYAAMDYINSRLPESSRIFCVWTGAYGYDLRRPYYTDTFLEDVTLKKAIDASSDGTSLRIRLEAMGFTHLYLRLSVVEKNLEAPQLSILHDLLSNQALEVFRNGDFAVYSLER